MGTGVLIVQLEAHHLEVVIALMNTFTMTPNVHYVLNEQFKPHLPSVLVQRCNIRWVSLPKKRGFQSFLVYLIRLFFIRRYAKRQNVQTLLWATISTATKARVISLVLRAYKVSHIIHNGHRFVRASPLLNKFYKNIYLSRSILEHMRDQSSAADHERQDFFWATNFRASVNLAHYYELDSEKVHIGIAGGVNQKRRNYDSLIDAAVRCKSKGICDRVRFWILGACPDWFTTGIRASGVEECFVTFSAYLSFDDMFSYVRSMDALALLIDDSVPNYVYYGTSKISGMENLALGFRIPLLVAEGVPVERELEALALRYKQDRLADLLITILENGNRSPLKEMYRNLPSHDEWESEMIKNENRILTALGVIN